MSASFTFVARNLFRKSFSTKVIVGGSLLGSKSTTLKDHAPLPSVDPTRRDAIIDFCLKTYGFEVIPWNPRHKGHKKRVCPNKDY
ncbi:unnamed protein product [Allacma fusca]|uniref:Uncharacterized protein n=1 Tax=Allacma fusca TaxID=39272 RepID=A0A8J2PIN3_9HEXA|nr:unnamed protein product [Allacma fusca]